MSDFDREIVKELRHCEFKFWYPLFSKYSMKSHVLELPVNAPSSSGDIDGPGINMHQEFIAYLQQDGIILPDDHLNNQQAAECSGKTHKETFHFITSSVSGAMKTFRERDDSSLCYFIKTNWSCPSDAKWILTGQCLKCYAMEDVYTVLKASDRTLYDVELLRLCNQEEETVNAGLQVEDSTSHVPASLSIVTRKWANLNPAMEFRCFVRGGELIAISQRECTTCYPFLTSPKVSAMLPSAADSGATASVFEASRHAAGCTPDESPAPARTEAQEDVVDRIAGFFDMVLKPCAEFPCQNYTFDVYLDQKDRVWLVDVGIYDMQFLRDRAGSSSGSTTAGEKSKLQEFVHYTDPLLFSYAELESVFEKVTVQQQQQRVGISSESCFEFPVLKVVESKSDVMLSDAGTYRVPVDVYASNDFQASFMDVLANASAAQQGMDGSSSSEDEQ